LMTTNLRKKIQQKNLFDLFLIKNCNLLIPKLQEKPSALNREHPHSEKWNLLTFFYVFGSFLPSWIRIRIANPDPGTPLDPDLIRIWIHNTGSRFGPVSKRCGSGTLLHIRFADPHGFVIRCSNWTLF
jgi:hypothetical protein